MSKEDRIQEQKIRWVLRAMGRSLEKAWESTPEGEEVVLDLEGAFDLSGDAAETFVHAFTEKAVERVSESRPDLVHRFENLDGLLDDEASWYRERSQICLDALAELEENSTPEPLSREDAAYFVELLFGAGAAEAAVARAEKDDAEKGKKGGAE